MHDLIQQAWGFDFGECRCANIEGLRAAVDAVWPLAVAEGRRQAVDEATYAEATRIITGAIERIDAYETAILTVVTDEAQRKLVDTVIRQCREAVAAETCICPRLEITPMGSAEPEYLPGLSPLCGVHGQGMRRENP